MRWRLDPKREDLKLHLVLNHRDEAPQRSSLRILSKLFFFFVQNSSIYFPKKQTGGDKGALLLVVRERLVAPLFAHVSRAVLVL